MGNTNDNITYVDGSYYVATYLPDEVGPRLADQGNNDPLTPQVKSLAMANQIDYFWVNNSGVTPSVWENVTAELNTSVNCDGAYIYIESGYSISMSELTTVCETVDDSIDFIENQLNAEFPDVDGDSKIYILILDLNSRRPVDEAPFGYFRQGDQLNVNNSNHKDMIYFNINRVDHIETLPHELTHLSNYYYNDDEELWLNEGLAQYSQLALFGVPQTNSLDARIYWFEQNYSEVNLNWLQYDEGTVRDAQYGSSFLFTWYLSEQYGGNAIISDILTDSDTGIDSVEDALPAGVTFEEVFSNWLIANYVDDRSQNESWGYDALDIQINPVDSYTYSGGSHSFSQANMDQWSSAYYRIESTADAFDVSLDEDFYVNSIRIADGKAAVRGYINDPTNSDVNSNTTVTNADKHDETVIVVSGLDETGDFQLSLDDVETLDYSVPAGGSAIFLIPVEEGSNYSRHGDVFTSVWWETAANIDVDLSPVGFTTTVETLPCASPLIRENIGYNCDSTEIWKLEIDDSGMDGTTKHLKLASNYYDGQLDGSNQVHTLPTVLEITPIDMIVEDESDTIQFNVMVLDGSIPFSYAPFAAPTAQNFEISIGGVAAESISMVSLSQSVYRLTVDPAQYNPGRHDLEVSFTYSKFGVSNTASTNEKDLVLNLGDGLADIALVIDSSGSMTSTDPNNLRKMAARLFVDLANDDDQIAVVDFDSYSHLRAALCNVGNNRNSLKSAINAIDSLGGTNIGVGLNTGYNQLNGANAISTHTKTAILLSDGRASYPSLVVNSYVSNGWPIYTIAHSDSANEDLMKSIAQSTGGEYYKTKASCVIMETYIRIRRCISDIYQIQRETGTISSGESIEGSFTTDYSVDATDLIFYITDTDVETASLATSTLTLLDENETENGLDYVEDSNIVTLSTTDNSLSLILYYPNGTEVSLNSSSSTGTNDSEIIYVNSDDYVVYKIEKQLSGNWTYNMSSTYSATKEYVLLVDVNTSSKFDVSIDKEAYYTGEKVNIAANLYNNTSGIENASVVAYMTLPDQNTTDIYLNNLGNGSYEGSTVYLLQEGTYELIVEAIKDDIIRQEYFEFEVSDSSWVNFMSDCNSGSTPFTVNFTDLSTSGDIWEWDIDGDNVVDYVTQNVTHTYTSPGIYNVSLTVGNGTAYGTETKISYIHVFDDNVTNGGFETGDLYGWSVCTEGCSHYEIAEKHNYSGIYGCELNASLTDSSGRNYLNSSISLTQSVNLTNVEYVTFYHNQTYANGCPGGYAQLEFYVDDNMTIIPFSNVWKQESVYVSNYSGNHNIFIKLFEHAYQPSSLSTKVEIDNILLVHKQKDWNPWNSAANVSYSQNNLSGNYSINFSEVNVSYIDISISNYDNGSLGDVPDSVMQVTEKTPISQDAYMMYVSCRSNGYPVQTQTYDGHKFFAYSSAEYTIYDPIVNQTIAGLDYLTSTDIMYCASYWAGGYPVPHYYYDGVEFYSFTTEGNISAPVYVPQDANFTFNVSCNSQFNSSELLTETKNFTIVLNENASQANIITNSSNYSVHATIYYSDIPTPSGIETTTAKPLIYSCALMLFICLKEKKQSQ
ncbi:VWA domain-containing protein [Methanolobus sp. WCC1]|uniref:VWA domain-containing protein n=1 Tax=unclassified Methanolobus TaxID=2629569 RepID=UPI00324ADEBC